MRKSRDQAQKAANEWKARGFKSSSVQSEVTSQNRLEEVNPVRNPGPGSFRQSAPSQPQKSFPKPPTAFKPKEINPTTESGSLNEKRPAKKKLPPKSGTESPSSGPLKKKSKKTDTLKSSLKQEEKKTEDSQETPQDQNEGEATENIQKVKPKRKKQKFKGYVLFVGNLSFDTTKEDILKHFSKAGPIKEVRIPVNKEDDKPRGFAYLEVEEHVTYEKVLSLHHTFLNRRRINVECTFGGSHTSQKRKALIKKKTLKLRFLSREGKISSAKQRPWGKYTKGSAEQG